MSCTDLYPSCPESKITSFDSDLGGCLRAWPLVGMPPRGLDNPVRATLAVTCSGDASRAPGTTEAKQMVVQVLVAKCRRPISGHRSGGQAPMRGLIVGAEIRLKRTLKLGFVSS